MTDAHKIHWNQRYEQEYHGSRPPRPWLVDHMHIVRMRGQLVRTAGRTPTALDLACGPGRNTFCLAEEGWQTTGVDISDRAIALAQERAAGTTLSASLTFIVADLDRWRPAPDTYDLVVSFFFLDRALWPAMRDAVRPSGLLILETFNTHRHDGFPSDFLLKPGELYSQIQSWGWEILSWRSDGPDLPRPTDAIVAVKPDWHIN